MEGEWIQYKDAFVGVAEELCGRTSGKGGTPRSRNQGWWTEEVANAMGGGEAGSMAYDRRYYRQRRATTHMLKAPVCPEDEGSQENGGQSTEEELYRNIDEDGGKKMIFMMARDSTEDGRDVERGAVIKDNNGRLITESKEVFRIWAANFKELLNGKGAASCLELPSSVTREVEVEEIRQEEVEKAMHNMKKGKGQIKCG